MSSHHLRLLALSLLLAASTDGVRADEPLAELAWSTYFGGDEDDQLTAVVRGDDGSLFVAGVTLSSNPPVTEGAFQEARSPGSDYFVAKLTPAGDEITWCTLLGGNGDDGNPTEPMGSLAIDAAGRPVVAFRTTSVNLPVVGGFQDAHADAPDPVASGDIYVARLSADGSALEYSTYYGGPGDERTPLLAVDAAGGVYVTGTTHSPDLPTLNAWQTEHGGPEAPASEDAFLMRIEPGGSLAFSTYLGGASRDQGFGIAVAPDGSVVVVGETWSEDFPLHEAWRSTPEGLEGFVARFQPTGGTPVFCTLFGGSEGDGAERVVVDPGGFIHFVGSSESDDLPLHAGAPPRTLGDYDDVCYVARLTPDGQGLLRSRWLPGRVSMKSIGLGDDGSAYVAGFSLLSSNVEPLNAGSAHHPGDGILDVAGFKLSPDGRTLRWAFEISDSEPGAFLQVASGLAVEPSGGFVLAGVTSAETFPTLDAMQPESGGGRDGILLSIEPGEAVPHLREPSARDARNWVDPLEIVKTGGVLAFDLGWEESMGEPSYGLVVGDLRELWTENRVATQRLACDLTEPSFEAGELEGDAYFLVVTVDKDAPGGPIESSYGRDFYGVERPPADPSCID